MHNPNDKTDYLVILANTLDESDEIREEAISELKALGISDNEIKERYKSLESEVVQLKAFASPPGRRGRGMRDYAEHRTNTERQTLNAER